MNIGHSDFSRPISRVLCFECKLSSLIVKVWVHLAYDVMTRFTPVCRFVVAECLSITNRPLLLLLLSLQPVWTLTTQPICEAPTLSWGILSSSLSFADSSANADLENRVHSHEASKGGIELFSLPIFLSLVENVCSRWMEIAESMERFSNVFHISFTTTITSITFVAGTRTCEGPDVLANETKLLDVNTDIWSSGW